MFGLYRSMGFWYGPDEDNLLEYDFITDQTKVGQPADLITGVVPETPVSFTGPKRKEVQVYLKVTQPTPFMLTSLMYDTDVEKE